MKVNARMPRSLKRQNAWYYLPYKEEKFLEIHQDLPTAHVVIRLPAKKLLKELQSVLEKVKLP